MNNSQIVGIVILIISTIILITNTIIHMILFNQIGLGVSYSVTAFYRYLTNNDFNIEDKGYVSAHYVTTTLSVVALIVLAVTWIYSDYNVQPLTICFECFLLLIQLVPTILSVFLLIKRNRITNKKGLNQPTKLTYKQGDELAQK